MRRTVLLPGSGQRLINVHPVEVCRGEFCCIHRPSNHHMRGWPMYWRSDRGLMERICPHGIGHPDPDEINPDVIHGCDGCCAVPRRETDGQEVTDSGSPGRGE